METISTTELRESSQNGHARAALNPELLEALEQLDQEEQTFLLGMIERATRDRETLGPLDELSFVANALKTHESDDLSVFAKLSSKRAPHFQTTYPDAEIFPLSQDLEEIDYTLPEVLRYRASKRDYAQASISFEQLSTLLYFAYGKRGTAAGYNIPNMPLRFAPSSGGLQSVELYMVVNDVDGLEQGVYHFDAVKYQLELIDRGNFRWKMVTCCAPYDWISRASVVFCLAPNVERLAWKYGRRTYRMVHLDTGVVAQNLHLVATGLGLGSTLLMGYRDDQANSILRLTGRTEYIALMMTVGQKLR